MARSMDSIDHILAHEAGEQINSSCDSAILTHELQLNEMIFSGIKPMALKAAVLLNIPDIIATKGNGGPLSVEQIASHIAAANPPASSATNSHNVDLGYLYRILRFLASYGVFTEQIEEADQADEAETCKKIKYGLTTISKLLAQGGNQPSSAPLVLLAADRFYLEAYQHLHESVLEGCYTFNKAFGMSPWEYLGRNPEANRIFNEAMATDSSIVMDCVAKMYEDGFKSINTLVDIGGGTGSSLAAIVKEHPHIRGINLDLPHVIAAAPPITGKICNVEHHQSKFVDVIHHCKWMMNERVFQEWSIWRAICSRRYLPPMQL